MKNSGLAISSLVLGIVGLVLKFIPFMGWIAMICAVVGVVLGILGKSNIIESKGEIGGLGIAKAGIILNIITLGLWVLGLVACASILGSF